MQTDADRERVVEGTAHAAASGTGPTRKQLAGTIKKLAKRWSSCATCTTTRAPGCCSRGGR